MRAVRLVGRWWSGSHVAPAITVGIVVGGLVLALAAVAVEFLVAGSGSGGMFGS